jgi:dienelactone hydrolase
MARPIAQLPDVLRNDASQRIDSVREWTARREELIAHFQREVFGPLPPTAAVTGTLIAKRPMKSCDGMQHEAWLLRVDLGPGIEFVLDIYHPDGDGPFPVLIDGDGCWRYLTDEVLRLFQQRGYAVAQFNRTVIMPDVEATYRNCHLWRSNAEADYRAISAWAWGYHRVADFLLGMDVCDPRRLGTCGHSRGGKASLLAGATDERFTLVSANAPCCGGTGSLRYVQRGGEYVHHITAKFPFWFADRFADYARRESELPIDSHDLAALVAPRPLLSTEAFGDLWSNAAGTLLSHGAARPAYALHDALDKLALHLREGDHRHDIEDWQALLGFADVHWFGRDVVTTFNNEDHAARLTADPLCDSAGNAYDWPRAEW